MSEERSTTDDGTVPLPVDGVLDLHTFRPQDVTHVVGDYLQACHERGLLEIRVIHGKGIGELRRTVRACLKTCPLVESFADASQLYGGLGATIVQLKSQAEMEAHPPDSSFRIVRLDNGAAAVHSLAEGETMHLALGPADEARTLYVEQLGLSERIASHPQEFVVWDIGLGAAANALAVIQTARHLTHKLRLVSFDHTLEPLRFALQHTHELDYLKATETYVAELLARTETSFCVGELSVNWRVITGDFPTWLASAEDGTQPRPPAPDAILFDAYSPAKNPAMWTAPLFANLFRALDPHRPCSLATYSRSTMIRVALLLAGFCVGAGRPTGSKEETTLASNSPGLILTPLDRRWLERARRSDAAEPLWESVYRRTPLTEATWEELSAHPQFVRPASGQERAGAGD